MNNFIYEARVKITGTSAGSAAAGIFLLRAGGLGGFNFNVFTHQDNWKLYNTANKSFDVRGSARGRIYKCFLRRHGKGIRAVLGTGIPF